MYVHAYYVERPWKDEQASLLWRVRQVSLGSILSSDIKPTENTTLFDSHSSLAQSSDEWHGEIDILIGNISNSRSLSCQREIYIRSKSGFFSLRDHRG